MRGAAVRAALPAFVDRLPLPGNRRYGAAIARLHGIVEGIVAGDRAGELVSMLTAAGLTGRQLHDEVVSILIAGTDSVAATLSWVFHEVGRHPDVERRLHVELDRLDQPPADLEGLQLLEYTGRVLAETLRLHGLWMVMRRTLAPVDLGGVRIPAGAEVLYSLYALHRDPAVFAEPDHFDPDRWLPERVREVPRHAFVPFGAGAHRCLGEHFGVAEATVATAAIAGRWRLRPVPGHRVREVATAVVHPDHLPMIVEPL
jgi:cytochrome P450